MLNKGECDSCAECLENCPNGISSVAGLGCRHCEPENAACANACARGALYEIAEGVIAVNSEACNGCGKCADACSEKAISIEGGKAVKCDLCASAEFCMRCIFACAKGALSAAETQEEIQKVRDALGWYVKRLHQKAIRKVLSERKEQAIVENTAGERLYVLREFPELSLQEAGLVKKIVEEFREADAREGMGKVMRNTLEEHCEKRGIVLDAEQEKYLLLAAELMVFGLGPVSVLLEDDEIEEIAAVGKAGRTAVYIYDRCFGWLRTNITLHGDTNVKNLINKMARPTGRRVTMQSPKLNAVLPDGSRLSAAAEPLSFGGICFTIRKFRQKPFSPLELVANNTISAEALAFLWMALQTDCSMLICGNTGSGKTTTLNALFEFMPREERIIITEETPEIRLKHEHVVKLRVANEIGIGMGELITETLRMRPDRVAVGEMRDREEVGAFIDTILAGQGRGSYATFHAQSAAEALARLRNLGVSEMDLSSIGLVIVQKRWNSVDLEKGTRSEMRRVVEIAETGAGRQGINPLFGFNYGAGRLEAAGKSEKIMQKIMHTYNGSRKEVETELDRRAKAIAKCSRKHGRSAGGMAGLFKAAGEAEKVFNRR